MSYYRIRENNRLEDRAGIPIGDHLAVIRTEYWRIYNARTGKRFVNINFATKELAVQAATIFDAAYRNFMWILLDPEWRDANIPSLVQWTIRSGVALCHAIESLENDGAVVADNYKILQACRS